MLTNAMYELFLKLVDQPELAERLPVIPCALLAALLVEDDASRTAPVPLPKAA